MAAGRLGWTMAAMVLTATLTGMGAPAAPPDGEWRVFRDRALGFTFAYPPGWSAMPGCHGNRRCVAVSEQRGGPDDYAIALEGFAGGLEPTATGKSVFRRAPDGWVAEGRFASHPARPIAEGGWHGLEAVVDCGVSAGGDVHAAAGECLWAVLSDGRMSVVADTQGTSPVGEDVRRILRSVRFIPR